MEPGSSKVFASVPSLELGSWPSNRPSTRPGRRPSRRQMRTFTTPGLCHCKTCRTPGALQWPTLAPILSVCLASRKQRWQASCCLCVCRRRARSASSRKAWQSPPSILHNAATVLLAAECSIDASAEVQAFSWKGPGVEAHFVPTSPLNAWYRELDATSRDSHVWGHSTHWTSAPYILREGCVRPQSWRQGAADAALGEPELPTTGFFCQASQGALTEWGIKQAAGKVLKMARASCGPIIIGIINHAPNHATVEGGGNWKIQACARTAGLCRGPDSYCARSDLTLIRGIVFHYPA